MFIRPRNIFLCDSALGNIVEHGKLCFQISIPTIHNLRLMRTLAIFCIYILDRSKRSHPKHLTKRHFPGRASTEIEVVLKGHNQLRTTGVFTPTRVGKIPLLVPLRAVDLPPRGAQRQPGRVVNKIMLVVLRQQGRVPRQPELHQKVLQCAEQTHLRGEKAAAHLHACTVSVLLAMVLGWW